MRHPFLCECGRLEGWRDSEVPSTALCASCRAKKLAEAVRLANIAAMNRVEDALAREPRA